jgi:putative ABC transport system substrate-binding protein
MKKRLTVSIVVVMVLLAATLLVGCGGEETGQVKIGITQIVEHPSLDATREGFKDALADQGYVEGENITYDYQNAQGDMSTAQTIATNFGQDKLDLILSIATPTSQAVVNNIKDVPILISAVTDPVGAGLVESLEKPGSNVTGTSDLTPVGEQFKLFKQLDPDIETVGIMYNSGEGNSVYLAEVAEEKADELGLELVKGTVTASSEVYQTAQSLVGRVDAIYIPTDNTVISAVQSVIKVANENDLPLVVADNNSVEAGALATMGIDYYELGRRTGEMAVRILEEGTAPKDIPVERIQQGKLMINLNAAEKMNVEVPQDLIDKADKVIK